MDPLASKKTIRFLSFDGKEDAEKEAKLKEAAKKIEQAIAQEKELAELVDYKPPPEENFDLANDTRPLYERLLEQRNKKQEELDETHKLSNMISRLDEDDVQYLNEIAKQKRDEEVRKRLEIYDALEEKKRQKEKKLLEDEKRLKESLSRMPTSKSKSSLALKIKVKPKKRDPGGHSSSKI